MTPILAAAAALAAEAGINAVQIAPVAERAGIAPARSIATFPSKTDLVAALVASVSERELGAMRRAADAAPGPLSALAAALHDIRGARAGKPQARLRADRRAGRCRKPQCAARLSARRSRASLRRGCRRDDARQPSRTGLEIAAPALIGALCEGLIGPARRSGGRSSGDARLRCRP
jgi:AcrR family transcriptional regulator